jgi:hypothetical protein
MQRSRLDTGIRLVRAVFVMGLFCPGFALAATISGTAGPDNLEGTPDDDTINGGGGADR